MFVEWLNPMAQGWARWAVISTVDATVVLAAVTVLWLACRRKLSAQFGYLLFLLVFVKLLVPVEIAVPPHWAVSSPGYYAAERLAMWQRSPGTMVLGEEPTKADDDLAAGHSDRAFGPAESPVEQEGPSPAIRPAFSSLDRPAGQSQFLPDEQESTAAIQPIEAAPAVSARDQRVASVSLAAWAMLAWTSVVIALLGAFSAVQWRLSRELRGARPIDSDRLSLSPEALRERIGLRQNVRVLESERIASPAVWGVFRPVIVLPTELCDRLAPTQLEWVLLHELAHVRRGDVAAAWFQQLATSVFCFNPAVWIAGRMLHALREYACDDVALAAGSATRRQSGDAFLLVAERACAYCDPVATALGLCNTKSTLRRRLIRLLDTNRPLKTRLSLGALAVLLVLGLVLLPSFRAGETTAIGAARESAVASTVTTTSVSEETAAESGDAEEGVAAKPASRSLLLTVLDDNDKPVPGAKVTVRIRQVTRGPWKVTRHPCDERGRLRVDVPQETPHYYALRVELPGFAPFWAEWENRDVPDPIPESYTARLDPGRLIGGIVQNEEGEPIQGAKVSPRFNLKMREERTRALGASTDITTDAQGRWTYLSFPADLRQLEIGLEHPDYLATRATEPTSKFALSADEAPAGVLVMKRGLPITGKVTDEEGRPVAGAVVRYRDSRDYGIRILKAETDENGSYRLANGRPGDTFLTASAEGWAPSLEKTRIAPDMDPVDFKLTRGRPLRVRVVDPDGKPLPRVGVELWTWQQNDISGVLPSGCGETDADGVWTWPHAPQGPIAFAISKRGYAYVGDRELAAGPQENVVTMHPEKVQLLSVAGRVLDARTKQPIARFRITPGFRNGGRETDYWLQDSQAEGRGGTYRRDFSSSEFASPVAARVIRIEADGYLPATSRPIKFDEGSVTLDFELEPAAASGPVVLTPQGQAAGGATVAVCTPRLGPSIRNGVVSPNSTCPRTTTDAQGRFAIAPQEGEFALMVVHESGAAYVAREDFERSNKIRLEPWARIEGTVLVGNKPAADQLVTLQRDEPSWGESLRVHYDYRATTDRSGRFVFENVIPGDARVTRSVVSEHGQTSSWISTHSTKVTLAPGETAQVEVSRDGRPVVGKLLAPQDAEIAPVWHYAMISLQGSAPASPPMPFPKEIDPQKDREAAIKWWETWKETEEGKRYQEEMKRYAEAVNERQSEHYSTKVEADGSFRFDDVPAGDYLLHARLQAPPASGQIVPGPVIANLRHALTVPEMPGGRSDEPLDLGGLTLTPARRP
ncbi:MAG TPA: carboxypeptidase regulatory-like domain-containing protein [Thermoguttaceae bacterium]|nr:carboxypeptidase regulatory-like domain-containing protein [Thermoguttaceae bacterium]